MGGYDYPHSGFAWCWVREILDKIGGLFELGGMGSGDHHMAPGIAGSRTIRSRQRPAAPAAMQQSFGKPARLPPSIASLGTCSERSSIAGTAIRRGVPTSRWDMFTKHRFNPHPDLLRRA